MGKRLAGSIPFGLIGIVLPILIFFECLFSHSFCYGEANCISGDCQNGHGVRIYDGLRYEGTFRNGVPSGQGTYILPEATIKGRYEVHDGKLWGIGIMTLPNGLTLASEWIDGDVNGDGIETIPNGVKYRGEFLKGKHNGYGILTFPSGFTFSGEFHDDKPNGDGIRTSSDGTRYEGEWREYKPNGHGIIHYPDGSRFAGEFRMGNLDGFGVRTLPDGKKYFEEWRNGELVWKFRKENESSRVYVALSDYSSSGTIRSSSLSLKKKLEQDKSEYLIVLTD